LKKIGLVVKSDPEAIQKADELEQWFQARGISIVRRENAFTERRYTNNESPGAPSDLFCTFVLGGDGTFLSAVRWIGDQNIPILGVKFGEVGFLAETAEESLFAAAEAVLNNRFTIQSRMRLQVEVERDGKPRASGTVYNDIVINKGALARLAEIETYIDDRYLTTYRADGLIISTPTGSTAYSLAAGGPIIHPAVPGIVMTPICPFTLTVRPLIVPESVCIRIRLAREFPDIMLTFDGQLGLDVTDRDTILIRKGLHPVQMIRITDQQYFDILKAKLRWSGGRV